MLGGRPQRMLDAAAVNPRWLELVERDDDDAFAGGGDQARQREHLVGEAADVASEWTSGNATEKRPGGMTGS